MGKTVNIKEAADMLGISRITLKRWLNSGNPDLYIPHWKSGSRGDYKFDADEVHKWKEARKQRTQLLQPASS